jgi:protein involved in polysaccharide export with SLBB domain
MKKHSILLFIFLCATVNAQFDNNKNESYLTGANLISVTVGGKFITTGTFPASSTERVDQFITRMFNQGKEKLLATATNISWLLPQIKKEIADYSFRDIKLKRIDGKEIILDLEKFRLNGDFVNNPYLKNDDILIFPPADLERNFFSVFGAVNNPGKFHFVDGDKLKDAIEFAGGINKAYENVTNADINRLSYDGREQKVISVDINSDFSLQRGDRIVIVANETMKKDFSIMIFGEVNAPGVIPITKDKTTLYEVINKAGGLTKEASLKHAKLFTGNSVYSIMEKQFISNVKDYPVRPDFDLNSNYFKIEQLMMSRMSNIVPEDTAYFYAENQLRVLMEGSTLDFTKLSNPNSEVSKYFVKDNDIVIIPSKDSSVYVFGQVLSPGHITYIPGKDFKYYIEKANGYGDFAEKSDVMIIKGVTNSWIEAVDNIVIDEGDYIYIPRKTMRSYNSYINIVGTYLGIVGSAATIILLLLQFKK